MKTAAASRSSGTPYSTTLLTRAYSMLLAKPAFSAAIACGSSGGSGPRRCVFLCGKGQLMTVTGGFALLFEVGSAQLAPRQRRRVFFRVPLLL